MNSRPRSVDELRLLEQRGEYLDLCFFWGHQRPRGGGVGPSCLSQWWAAEFVVDDISYPTAEHFMMAGKARLFGDEAMLSRILSAPSPRAVKRLGRAVRGYDEEQWTAYRYSIVVEGNFAKFSQNPELRAYLLSTGGCLLVEASPDDRVWGIGLAAEDRRARLPSQWPGTNLLGFAIMDVRDRLAATIDEAT